MTGVNRAPSTDETTRPGEIRPAFERFLDTAITSLAEGDARSALLAASEACHLMPGEPRAHYAYGQAWLAVGAPARAEQAFAAALGLTPDWGDAWVNYGIARYRQGHVGDAMTAMRQALMRAPGHAGAITNLGAFMRISGEAAAVEALLRDAILRDPANSGARLNLVADLMQQERAADALALLDRAAPPAGDAPAARHWHLQRSLALLQLGRPDAASAALDACAALGPLPPDLMPLWHWRQVLLAVALNDPARASLEAGLMEDALGGMGPDAVPEHRIMAHFDLAKFWSGRNAHRRAFRHWVEGHAQLKQSQPFFRDEHAAFIDANIAVFDRARFTAGAMAGNADPMPVFIVGMPRSGTTLCEQILAAHPDVHGAGERAELGRTFAMLGGKRQDPASVRRIAGLDARVLDTVADRYLADLRALAPGRARVIDKMPGNYAFLGLVGLILPGARIIHCVRDPRDIGLSIFTFRFHGQHPYAHDLADLGWTIAQQSRLMAHWRAVLPNPILTVRLSDWVEDFADTLHRVLTHLGLPPDPACARFYENEGPVRTVSRAQVRQPVNARGLGRWRTYAADLAPLIAALEESGALAGWE